jgi:hypothetical protein
MLHRLRNRSVLAVFVSSCTLVVAFSRPAWGQFNLPGIFGGAQNVAVSQALSQFGKSIGAQLPIVVNDGDAYPTTPTLPGPAFRPGQPPSNLIALLRKSTDGTVPMRPGDYSLGVNVFCMRIHAHSPAAHRYLVAPLKGSAADIIQALNARAPAYNVEHFSLQILSWNIQGGLPYGSMQPAQRAIVDKVIPEYRSRLKGDPLENIRSKFDALSSIPGMPSFDDAMGRLGPVGQAVLTMESVRQQLAQPPATFAQMAQSFVPFSVPASGGGPGSTPWSQYSNRVFVRFVTSGGFADPGTYEVRVLPATVSVASSHLVAFRDVAQAGGAGVPMSNIVNNPGTGSVQPLTQGPNGGGGNENNPTAPPTPTPTPSASISSETAAESPSDRARTTIGVAEQVTMTFSGASASWSISGGGGKLSGSSGKTNVLIAGDVAGACTITAVDTSTHASASISFTIIPPNGIHNERVPGSMIHDQGWPNSGFNMHVYLTPDTVSFENLEYREHDANAVATGIYSFENHASHVPKNGYVPVGADVPGKGSEVTLLDSAYSGYQNIPPPFTPGHVQWTIPLYYRSQGHTQEYHFYDVVQNSTLANDRVSLETVKGDASANTVVSAPTIDQ